MVTTSIMRVLQELKGERKIQVEYIPDYNFVLFDSHETFSNSESAHAQSFETDEFYDWYIVEICFSPYLVAVNGFDFLKMSGSKGAKKQRKIMEKYNRTLFSSKELGAKGVAMTIRDYLQMPTWWKQSIGECYVCSTQKDDQIYFANSSGIIHKVSQNIVKMKVPILVKLPKDTLVSIDKSSSGEIIRLLRKSKRK